MKNLASKKRFQILDHPADLKIKVWGSDLEDFFQNILEAILKATDPDIVDQNLKIKIKIRAQDLESLVFDFLTDLIYQMDVNDAIFIKGTFNKISEIELDGFLVGKKIKRVNTEIKGITWHNFSVKKEGNHCLATFLFDV